MVMKGILVSLAFIIYTAFWLYFTAYYKAKTVEACYNQGFEVIGNIMIVCRAIRLDER